MKESVFTKTINITNRNVYLTNFLLIPALMYALLAIHDIKNWKDIPKDDNLQKYLYIWYFFAGLFFRCGSKWWATAIPWVPFWS